MTAISNLLLPWFERHGRKDLPWQIQPDAYRIWLSEIMLQQTQVATVIPYFKKFVASFPTLVDLANARLDEVLQHWAGLGYYARARNLHKAAMIVRDEYQGEIPSDIDLLMALPGIGRSTAGAILSLAHGHYAPILDGNVKRVLARLYQVSGWPGKTATQKQLWKLAETQTPSEDVRHYNQAMMDLGALVCRRTQPKCEHCPLSSLCQSFLYQTQSQYPQAKPQKNRPHKHCWLLLHSHNNHWLLERRPPKGIWGGLWSLPELESLDLLQQWQVDEFGVSLSPSAKQEKLLRHKFTHFDLTLSLVHIPFSENSTAYADLTAHLTDNRRWVRRDQLDRYGLPAPVASILRNL
ncbi:MAG: A/G-specific adenine glycosylase [Gammaproteobacteria bacterium]|nr:A/G-specific adenine glycosylase [Gammaproteobacteria bacterium]